MTQEQVEQVRSDFMSIEEAALKVSDQHGLSFSGRTTAERCITVLHDLSIRHGQLQTVAARRLEMLRELEWIQAQPGGTAQCPLCRHSPHEGHVLDCRLASELHGATPSNSTCQEVVP